MERVWSWFAVSPLATAARVGLGAGLVFVLDHIADFRLDPVLQVAVVAAVSTVLRWVNPLDGAYGKTAE